MEKKLTFSYDKDGDVLDIFIGKPQKAVSKEISEDFFIRMEPKTKEIIGFMVLNFEKRFGKKKPESLPILGNFKLAKI